MVLSGEARCARQIVTVSNSDGKITYIKPHYPSVSPVNLNIFFVLRKEPAILFSFWQLISYCFFFHLSPFNIGFPFCSFLQMRNGDVSTAESGSEAEEIATPKAARSYVPHPKLTPVREEVSFWHTWRFFSCKIGSLRNL